MLAIFCNEVINYINSMTFLNCNLALKKKCDKMTACYRELVILAAAQNESN